MLDVVVCDGSPPSRGAGRMVNVWRDDRGRPFAEAASDGRGYRIDWRGLGILTFTPGSLNARLWPEPGLDADAALSTALRIVQPVILQALGRQTLHASAVRLPRGIVAFCGLSGSGKSTLAFALGQRPGLTQIADDAVVLDVAPAEVTVTPLPFRERLRAESRDFFGDNPAISGNSISALQPAPLLAVFTLAQSPLSGTLDLSRIPAASAFTALLTHAHCFDESDRPGVVAMIEAYLTIAEFVPVHRLTYSPDFSRIEALQELVLSAVAVPR